VYAATILLSALLLFLVQPLIGRYILPWFGGSSAVWSASMLFFQVLLLVGYLYSHVLARRLSRRHQMRLHSALVALSVLLLTAKVLLWETPITPPAHWAPMPDQSPVGRILVTLAAAVGLPYLVLSTTSPLVQTWFAERYPDRSPYPLYALSNAGSVVALLAYPLLLQRLLTTSGQAWVWVSGYVGFAACAGAVAWLTQRRRATEMSEARPAARDGRVVWWRPVLWVALSATSTVILLGATNEMTQNVAAVPLLWVVPLTVYLLTFVLAFSLPKASSRWYLYLLAAAMPALRIVLLWGGSFPILFQLGTHILIVLAACLTCHGELARLRPAPSRLTDFYLAVAAGGALGGVFVSLVAPVALDSFWELPIGVLVCWVLAGVSLLVGRAALPERLLRRNLWQVLLAALATLYGGEILWSSVRIVYASTLAATRNFYGALRVQRMVLGDGTVPNATRLVHGLTIHGVQFDDAAMRVAPTSYFAPTSGVGVAMSGLRRNAELDGRAPRIGVLGLGIGTLAAYAEPGDVMRFYEIDPLGNGFAEGDGGYFSYLEDSDAEIEIVTGDARLSLERELAQGGSVDYDMLVVDVFSGDAPPVHLLTRESLEVYLAHLAPKGVLALNISTMHLNLKPVIAALALDADLAGVEVEDNGDGWMSFPSRWVLMARSAETLVSLAPTAFPNLAASADPAVRLWTDDYSDLIAVLD